MTEKKKEVWDARKAQLCSLVTKKQIQHKADQEGFDRVMRLIIEAAKQGHSNSLCFNRDGRWLENMSERGKQKVWARLQELGFTVTHEFPADEISWEKPYGKESKPKAPQSFLSRLKEILLTSN